MNAHRDHDTMTDVSVQDFVASQRNLLELELKAEEEEEQSIASSIRAVPGKNENDERPAHVLRHLEIYETSVGLYGRTVVTLTVVNNKDETELLPAHLFSVGDEVEIHSKTSNRGNAGGVISAITETSIAIALFGKRTTTASKSDENNDDEEDSVLGSPPFAVVPQSSVEVHRKLVRSLGELERHGSDHPVAGNVVNALFGPPQSFAKCPTTTIEPFNTNLDMSQLEAITFAVNSGDRPISLIHGPPGTGKTTTIAELIQQAVHVSKWKVLVCAPSNVAVDNVLERLVANQSTSKSKRSKRNSRQKLKAVRLGHPARIKASILPYSLESLVQNADGTEIVSEARDELQSFLRILSNPKSRGADKRLAYREVKALRKEVRTREQKVVKDLVSEAHVILATNVGAANSMLKDVEFDLVVIDEAAQALEASCWIPILRGKRLVLAGDHCQLPPTIKSNGPGVQKGLGQTLFERIMEMYGDKNNTNSKGAVSRMLTVQYRMHLDIANWASAAMYHGQLETHENVKSRTLSQLPHIREAQDSAGEEIGEMRLLLIDTAGCEMHETVNAAGSRYNDGEAQIVAQHVQTLLAMGLKQEEIAVSDRGGIMEGKRCMRSSTVSSFLPTASSCPLLPHYK
jgi:ATP-dependent RNA/DNA helicase IGHMBP2